MHDDVVVCCEICGCFAWNNGGEVLVQRKCMVVCKGEEGRMEVVRGDVVFVVVCVVYDVVCDVYVLVLRVRTVVKSWRFLEILVGWSCGVK